jgi:hypothetical protein
MLGLKAGSGLWHGLDVSYNRSTRLHHGCFRCTRVQKRCFYAISQQMLSHAMCTSPEHLTKHKHYKRNNCVRSSDTDCISNINIVIHCSSTATSPINSMVAGYLSKYTSSVLARIRIQTPSVTRTDEKYGPSAIALKTKTAL